MNDRYIHFHEARVRNETLEQTEGKGSFGFARFSALVAALVRLVA